MKNIILCIFGVVPRSIKHTYPQIKKMIIGPISEKYNLKIYVFNLNVENETVDGVKMNQDDCKIIKYDYFEEHLQKDADLVLNDLCKEGICVIQNHNYDTRRTKNSMRVMYSEYQISKFLLKHKDEFDYAIIWSADFYPVDKLTIPDDTNLVYTNANGDYLGGYTDGFYMGKVENIIKIQERYQDLHKILPYKGNHELIFRYGFEKNGIKRGISNMRFKKIRANGTIRDFTILKWKKTDKVYPLPPF